MITPIEDTDLGAKGEVFCAVDGCHSEAAYVIDRSKTPICSTCHKAFEWGVSCAEEKAAAEIRGTPFALINGFRDDLINGRAICNIWTVNDVLDRADELGVDLTEDMAVEVLSEVDQAYDGSIGINWDVLDTHIQGVLEHKENV